MAPAKKTTKFLTNAPSVARELRVRCTGKHEHQSLVGGRAKDAEKYLEELCRAICRGLVREMKGQDMAVKAVAEIEMGKKTDKLPRGEIP
jgi:hypothetical protein